MNDDFKLIHDEFHRRYNKTLKSVIKEILDENEHVCLDSESDKEQLLSELTEKLSLA